MEPVRVAREAAAVALRESFVLRLGQEFVLPGVGKIDERTAVLPGSCIEGVEFAQQVIPRRVRQPARQQPVDETRNLRVAGAGGVRGRQDALGDRAERPGLVFCQDGERGGLTGGLLLVQVDMGEMGIREQFLGQQRQRGGAADHPKGLPPSDPVSGLVAWWQHHDAAC